MMIEWLSGKLIHSGPQGVIIDVQGVGYGVEVPLSVLCRLPVVGQAISFHVSTVVREDAIRLFGFATYSDRLAFEVLLSLNGVGPKVALAILSTLSVAALRHAVTQNDIGLLESVPGIGARTAEKIILELKPKIERLGFTKVGPAPTIMDIDKPYPDVQEDTGFEFPKRNFADEDAQRKMVFEDVGSALENLGYKDKVIQPLLAKLEKAKGDVAFQELMRMALGELAQGLTFKSETTVAKATKPPAKAAKAGLNSDLF